MKVCYFGDFDPLYARHIVLQDGLRKAGVNVVPCKLECTGIRKYWEIFLQVRRLPKDVDIILIAYSNSRFVWFVRLLTRKPIVWNAFYSIYHNWVFDRGRVARNSPRALLLWMLDFVCGHLSDAIIFETNVDKEYFCRTFHIRREKVWKILLGYNEYEVKPQPPNPPSKDKFIVHFHGRYIPLQGVPYIVEAAKLLEDYKDIHFNLIGEGQTYKETKTLAERLKVRNITFISSMTMKGLVEYMTKADVCIGLVGTVDRVNHPIPNKVYEAAGMRRAAINADTEAVRELFTDRKNILLVRRGDPRDIADKILELRNNPGLRDQIAEAGYQLVRSRASIEAIGKDLYMHLEVLLK